jgi:exopolysaccharide biosynthesis polyprenyl glycosylphosphotransferase
MSTVGHEAADGALGAGSSHALDLAAAPHSSTPHTVDHRSKSRGRAWRKNNLALANAAQAASNAVDKKSRTEWFRRYQRNLVLIDLFTAAVAALLSVAIRFGTAVSTSEGAQFYVVFSIILPLAWVAAVYVNRAYEARFVGVGAAEFQRIFHAFLHLTAVVAFASFIFKADLARGFVLVSLPLALAFDLLGRYALRKWLHRERVRGRALNEVVVVGDPGAIEDFVAMVRRDQYAGMRVVGACVPDEFAVDQATIEALEALDVPLLGDIDSVHAAVSQSSADTVAVVSSGAVGPEKLRWISWQLEGTSTALVVSPGLTEVAGPRLHVRPVAGLPLLHVEEPEFTGFRRVLKGAFDRSVALLALLVFSPVFISLAVAVRLNSKGPALFRQVRVGRDGGTFMMLKFRSMHTDAEERLTELRAQNENDGLLFKMRNDPRVTSVGRILRKFSLDELPQLINVLNGTMSLVGPRPPLPGEVAQYEDHVYRRLLVKPGVTGLWQVSGRSDLTWEESVRLDLRYVENWSLSEDLMILWKTVRAVTAGSGAY